MVSNDWGMCEYFTIGFALWTITSNVTALTTGSFYRLLISFAILCAVLGVAWLIRKFSQKQKSLPLSSEKPSTHRYSVQESLLWGLVLAAVCITLIAHRPDADDAQYLDWATFAVDTPSRPILHYTTMHSIPDVPIRRPAYKAQSLEMSAAACSFFTKIPAIYFMHMIFPAFFAVLAILAYGQLFKILAPKHWAWGVLAVMVFLLANADVHRTYGNFSFVRLQQGKGVWVTAILPLVLTYGLRFAMRPTWGNWLLLTSAQIAGMGMTATAIVVAPPLACFAVLAGLPKRRLPEQVKRVILGSLSSAYLLGIGAYIKLFYPALQREYEKSNTLEELKSIRTFLTSGQYQYHNLIKPFGLTGFTLACGLMVILTWWLSETRIARRFCLIFPLALLLFINPLSALFLMKYIIGYNLYWRVFWILPLPTIAGLALIVPLASSKISLPAWKRFTLYAISLLVLWTVLPIQTTLSPTNETRLGMPGLKVPQEFRIARVISETVEGRPNILAPEPVTIWMSGIHRHPYPLVARYFFAGLLGEQKIIRLRLKKYITGEQRPENAAVIFYNSLEHFQVKCVCFPLSNPWAKEIREVLNMTGFEYAQSILEHELWIVDESDKGVKNPKDVLRERRSK